VTEGCHLMSPACRSGAVRCHLVSRLVAVCVLSGALGCGTLTPPGSDGGADSGAIDSGTPGEWVELALPAGVEAPLSQLTAHPGAIYALVGDNTVLHSSGGRFDWVTMFDDPVVLHLASSQSGHVAFTAFQTLFSCTDNCGSSDSYADRTLPRTPIALCGGVDKLAALTTATDAGAALLNEVDGGWSVSEALEVVDPQGCVRMADTVFITMQGAVFNSLNHAAEHISVPGRDGALEPWRLAGSAGASVFVTSDLGAAAKRDSLGVWSATQLTSGVIDALAVESDDSAWVAAGNSMFRFAEAGWVSAGNGPGALTGIAGLALQPGSVYVGGVDAAGRPRIFRRQR
jgi:hypothetical protein